MPSAKSASAATPDALRCAYEPQTRLGNPDPFHGQDVDIAVCQAPEAGALLLELVCDNDALAAPVNVLLNGIVEVLGWPLHGLQLVFGLPLLH